VPITIGFDPIYPVMLGPIYPYFQSFLQPFRNHRTSGREICNQWVGGSSPSAGTNKINDLTMADLSSRANGVTPGVTDGIPLFDGLALTGLHPCPSAHGCQLRASKGGLAGCKQPTSHLQHTL
jgi:hypothetical protein